MALVHLWQWLIEAGASALFGYAAAIVPIFNNEAYIVGTQATGIAGAWAVIVGLTLGNALGKATVVGLFRAGRRLPWWRLPSERTPGDGWWSRARARWRTWMSRLLRWVNHPGWGPPLVALSAATSVPPLYPVTVLVAAGPMPLWRFTLAAALGLLARWTILVYAALGIISLV